MTTNITNIAAVTRGDIYFANLPTINQSHVQQGVRPVLVVSNDSNNKYSPTLTVVPLTSQVGKRYLPVHVRFSGYGLPKVSEALCEQIMTIDKSCLAKKLGHIQSNDPTMSKIETAIMIQAGILPATAANKTA